jgi:tetratricopeptide (TPR) repeat protein
MSLRSAVLLAALLHLSPALAAIHPSNEKALALLNEGKALQDQGKHNEAFQRFREAALADPNASTPVAMMAYMLYSYSKNAPAKEVPEIRQEAARAANAALAIDGRDPVAMEVLRGLSDDVPQQRHKPSDAAHKAMVEGELLFNAKQFDAARKRYELAEQFDPAYAEAVLLQGDCYFMLDDMAHAEQLFRKATLIDPLYGAAWRFLFDAQMRQEKFKDADASAIGAVAATPSERQSWMRVAALQDQWGIKMSRFHLPARASLDGGKITLDADIPEKANMVWLAYGMALASASIEKAKATPFARELHAWESTMQIAAELKLDKQIEDENLRELVRFHKAGQLKAAIFLLMYKEAYRADFEAWKKDNPGAIKLFIDTFHAGL